MSERGEKGKSAEKIELDRAWEVWYAGPETLPWPTNIWTNEDNLRKAFEAGIESMRLLSIRIVEKHAATQVDNGALVDCIEGIRATRHLVGRVI